MGLLFAFALMGLPLAYAVWSLVQDKDELEIVHHARRDPTEHRPTAVARSEPERPAAAPADQHVSVPPVASPAPGA